MKVASYIFYALAVFSILAGISASTFLKDEIGHVFGTGAWFVYGGGAVLFVLIGLAAQNLAARKL